MTPDIRKILNKLIARELSIDEAGDALERLQEAAICSDDALSSAESVAYHDGFQDGLDVGYDNGFSAGQEMSNDY